MYRGTCTSSTLWSSSASVDETAASAAKPWNMQIRSPMHRAPHIQRLICERFQLAHGHELRIVFLGLFRQQFQRCSCLFAVSSADLLQITREQTRSNGWSREAPNWVCEIWYMNICFIQLRTRQPDLSCSRTNRLQFVEADCLLIDNNKPRLHEKKKNKCKHDHLVWDCCWKNQFEIWTARTEQK